MRFEKLIVVLVLSIFAGCSCKDASKDLQDAKLKVAEPALAPGTAIVKAEVLTIDKKFVSIKIIKIEKRGQGTDALSKNKEVKLDISKSVEDAKIIPGEILKFKIKGSPVSAPTEVAESIHWRVINITK